MSGYEVLLIFIVPILFILVRTLWLWYWKIDVGIELLESIDKKMDVIINQGDIRLGNQPLGNQPEEQITTNTSIEEKRLQSILPD